MKLPYQILRGFNRDTKILDEERDSLKSSNEELSKEKGNLENKVSELELQKTTAE